MNRPSPALEFIKSEPEEVIINDDLLVPHSKKRRLIMEVVVPTLELAQRKRVIKKEEDSKLFESLHNVKWHLIITI